MTRTCRAVLVAFLLLLSTWAVAAPPLFLGVISDTQRPPQDPLPELNWAVDQLNELKPDAVLWTGDLTNGGAEAEYANVMRVARRLTSPLFALPGNHEAPPGEAIYRERFTRETGQPPWQHVRVGAWHLILLDSVRFAEGALAHDGVIGPEELAWLRDTVAAITAAEPVVLAAHHPFAVPGDGLSNAPEVIELLTDRALAFTVAGHFHGNRYDLGADGVHHFITSALSFSGEPLGYRLFSVAGTDLWTAWIATTEETPLGPWGQPARPGRIVRGCRVELPVPAGDALRVAVRVTYSGAKLVVRCGKHTVTRLPASAQPATVLVPLGAEDSEALAAAGGPGLTLQPLGEVNVASVSLCRTGADWEHYRLRAACSPRGR